jgi:hypothetical protein
MDNTVTDVGIGRAVAVSTLAIRCCGTTLITGEGFRFTPRLASLTLVAPPDGDAPFRVSKQSFVHLGTSLSELMFLQGYDNAFEIEPGAFVPLANLRRLAAHGVHALTDEFLVPLGRLEDLVLEDCNAVTCAPLACLPSLRRVEIGNCLLLDPRELSILTRDRNPDLHELVVVYNTDTHMGELLGLFFETHGPASFAEGWDAEWFPMGPVSVTLADPDFGLDAYVRLTRRPPPRARRTRGGGDAGDGSSSSSKRGKGAGAGSGSSPPPAKRAKS